MVLLECWVFLFVGVLHKVLPLSDQQTDAMSLYLGVVSTHALADISIEIELALQEVSIKSGESLDYIMGVEFPGVHS